MNKRQLLILSLAGILVVIKFVILPIIDWQNDKIESVEVQTKQLEKVIPLIDSREKLDKLNTQLSAEVEKLQGTFPKYQANENLRVKTQRSVEQIVKREGVNLEVFDWLAEIESPETNLTRVQFKLDVRGDVKELSKFHWSLYSELPSLILRDYELRTFTQRGKRTAELSVILDAYYFKDEGA